MTQPSALPLTVPDLVGLDDLDPFMSETTSDLQALQQDIYHLLLELFGTNPDDLTRGLGIQTYLSGTATQLTALKGRIEEQLNADDRIDGCTANVQQQSSGPYPWIIKVDVQVDGSVLGLSYGWSSPGGLVAVGGGT